MEYVIAAAFIALAGGVAYGIRRKSTPARPKAAEFVCHHCGERHCQCERKT